MELWKGVSVVLFEIMGSALHRGSEDARSSLAITYLTLPFPAFRSLTFLPLSANEMT